MDSLIQRLLKPIVEVRPGEAVTLLLMFAYSFLAMTSYNIVKPLATAKFISDLGADNLPYVLLVAGFVIGIVMQVYSRAIGHLPKKLIIPVTQGGIVAILVGFWFLFQAGQTWASVAMYFFRLVVGILLISQFWTLANDVYDPRQAKRVFGFIGGGSSLGGWAGSEILARSVVVVGTNNLLLVSAGILVACMLIVWFILGRTQEAALTSLDTAGEEKGVGGREALRMLRESKHLQVISVVIGFASLAAFLIEMQLNLAAQASQGREATAGIAALLGRIQAYTSISGFIIQIWLVARIHRYFGIGFALLVLPVSLGLSGVFILLTAGVTAAGVARVLDTSLRYTVDKTTREILFLPLPTDLKYQAKPFVDVTVDRVARGIGGVLALVLIKPWGLGLQWHQISYVSLIVMVVWMFGSIRARKGYLTAFRETIERRDVEVSQVRLTQADLSTVETLIEELADPDERRVLYAIDVLESLDKRNLVTPLLLYHESPRVRARALGALGSARPEIAHRWLPNIQAMMADPDTAVRAAAVAALASIKDVDTTDLIRPYVHDADPRLASTAAIVLARSPRPADVDVAEAVLTRVAGDTGAPAARRDVASALGQIAQPRFNSLLIPLLYDEDPTVAEEAMRSVRRLGAAESLFVPTLVSLLHNRRLKSAAREVLVGYGEDVVDPLRFFLLDANEDVWVRRHIPATLARIPSQRTMDVLVEALAVEQNGFLRYKLLSAVEKLHREHAGLTFDAGPLDKLITLETTRYLTYLSLHYNLFEREKLDRNSLLARALAEKMVRSANRLWMVLGLRYPWTDIVAARYALERGTPKVRASALEYLDNLLDAATRKRVMPVLDDAPLELKVKRANVVLKTRTRDIEETLLALINEEDEIVAAAAIDLVCHLRRESLADDIEHVLAHRDVKDWFVFEAASWSLAAFRMPEDRRRALWLEPLPAVEVAAHLRRIAAFKDVAIDELFRIARSGRQVRHEAGRVLYQAGVLQDSHQILLHGRVELSGGEAEARVIEAPAPLALEEMLRGRPAGATARTQVPSIVLTLAIDDMRTLLADNSDLVQGLFSMLLAPATADTDVLLHIDVELAAGGALPTPLRPIDKVMLLKRLPIFQSVPAEEILQLANIAREVPLAEGGTLFGEADPAACLLIVSGEVEIGGASAVGAGGTPERTAGAGDAIGLYQTLAGTAMGDSARVTRPGRALRLRHDDLYDVIGLRPGLLQHLFGALFDARREREAVPR